MKNIYLIVGRSGAGKTSIVEELCKRYGYSQVISYTDRPRREGEGNTHIFTDTNTMELLLKDAVAETYFCGHYYCTVSSQIEENDLYVIDPNGVTFMLQKYNGNKVCVIIYINCTEQQAHQRMLERGDKPIDIAHRLSNDNIDFKGYENTADYTVDNTDFDKCVEEIKSIIDKCEGVDGQD